MGFFGQDGAPPREMIANAREKVAAYPIGLLSHRSQQDNGQVCGAAQKAAEGQTVLAWHHDVKNHQVQSTSLEQTAQCDSTLRKADAVAMLHQVFADQIANITMIVHDGDVQCFSSGFRAGLVPRRSVAKQSSIIVTISLSEVSPT